MSEGPVAKVPFARHLFSWAPVALMMGVQVFLSSKSHLPDVLSVVSVPDKVLHASWFFLLGLLTYRAAREGEGCTGRRAVLVVVLGALLWGSSDELHQSFVPGRQVEVGDVAADVAGAALAALVAEPLLRRLGLLASPR